MTVLKEKVFRDLKSNLVKAALCKEGDKYIVKCGELIIYEGYNELYAVQKFNQQ